MSVWIRALAAAGVLCLAAASASAQVPAAGLPGTPYELRADFEATLALMIGSVQYTTTSQGEVRDRLGINGEHQITVAVRAVQAPLLLRPFKGSIASVTSELITSQADDPRAFEGYDLAVLETRTDGTSVLGGVRADIVDEALRRLPPSAPSSSPELRRAMAKALLTSPFIRDGLRRSGPPYAFRAVADAAGRLLESSVQYDWGSAESRLTYTVAEGRQVVGRLAVEVRGQVGGLGRVTGKMTVVFSNHAMALPEAGTGR